MEKSLRVLILSVFTFIILGISLIFIKIVAAQITPPDIYERDDYEPDDTVEQAKRILITNADFDNPQKHTFHSLTDIDWVYFYGHAEQNYTITTTDENTGLTLNISLKLWDPNNMSKPLRSSYGQINFNCLRDSYYYLQVEQPLNPGEGERSYILKVTVIVAAVPTAMAGRVVDRNGRGINGIRVEFTPPPGGSAPPPAFTGSLKKVKDNILDQAMSEGWYFATASADDDYYCLKFISKDNPDKILKQKFFFNIKPIQVNFIPDIVLDISGYEQDAISGYEQVLANFGHNYDPPDKDEDHDGLYNMEEFLYWTNPQAPSFKSLLHGGLNLLPFFSLDNYFTYSHVLYYFCPDNMEEGDSVWEYDLEDLKWNRIGKQSGRCDGGNFNLKNCNVYLYYSNHHRIIPQVILQDDLSSLCLEHGLIPGINLVIVSTPEAGQKEKYTSYTYLQEPRVKKFESISRYDPNNGKWESSCWFFDKTEGTEFHVSSSEAYITIVK